MPGRAVNDKRLSFQIALLMAVCNLGLVVYAYYLHPNRTCVFFAGLFLAFAVRSVSELRRLRKRSGVRV